MGTQLVAPFTGVWIEIKNFYGAGTAKKLVAPFTGVWIEIYILDIRAASGLMSHPSRVCGLKFVNDENMSELEGCRTLHGCVD